MLEDKIYKFVKIDDTSSMFDSLIQKNNQQRLYGYPSSVFDPSHITECPRRIIYRASGCISENTSSYLSSYDFLFSKKKWIEYLSQCKNIKVIDKNVVAADCHYNVSGNADVIINMGGVVYVVKIQPVNANDFVQIKKKGAYKKHVVELITYIWLTELYDGLLLYENKNNNEYITFHVKQYEPIIKSIMKKCLGLMENKIMGVIPPRPYKCKDSSECILCEFRKQCWQEKNKNV